MNHMNDLAHHVNRALAWLVDSEEGESTDFVSYAALEVRFAIERLAIRYWAMLFPPKPEGEDRHGANPLKRLEAQICALGQYQKEINQHFEFVHTIVTAMGIDLPIHTPNVRELAKYWHGCNELCHVSWPLSFRVPGARKQVYLMLVEATSTLRALVASLRWLTLQDPSFVSLRDSFVAGKASSADVHARVREMGIWAEAVLPGR